MRRHPLRCVLLTTDAPRLAEASERLVRRLFDVVHCSRHARSERVVPSEAREAAQGCDVLLNYLSPMILPAPMLAGVAVEAINIHPAPPDWPGVGSASYALFHGDREFGVTAHRMTAQIDAGAIVRVDRFPIYPDETCESLHARALQRTYPLFIWVCETLAREGRLYPSGQGWARPAITRAEFDAWMTLSVFDSADDIQKKVRALQHSRFPGPFVVDHGRRVPYMEAGA